jgi:hypothetical protein
LILGGLFDFSFSFSSSISLTSYEILSKVGGNKVALAIDTKIDKNITAIVDNNALGIVILFS